MSDPEAKPPRTQDRRTRKRSPGGEIGSALRAAYDDTLKEEVPRDLLDLLGKLD